MFHEMEWVSELRLSLVLRRWNFERYNNHNEKTTTLQVPIIAYIAFLRGNIARVHRLMVNVKLG